MAKEPTASNGTDKPKRKPQVRSNKPKVVFLAYKGTLDEVTVHTDREKLMDAMLEANANGDTSLKVRKVEIPVNRRSKAGSESTAPTA